MKSSLPLAVALLSGCTTPPARAPASGPISAAAAPIEVPPPPEAPAVPPARSTVYQRIFPAATRLEAKPIPREMLLSADRGNESYVEALDAEDQIVGYLRDFAGPLIPGREHDLEPISILVVFSPDLRLTALVPTQPLRKGGGELFTAADIAELVELAKEPPNSLNEYPRTGDVVDATTEATRPALHDSVVSGAAYTTHRVVGLVTRSRELIEKAPLAWDRRRLEQILSVPAPDLVVAHALAEILPTLETPAIRVSVYEMMARNYASGLRKETGKSDGKVEAVLLSPPVPVERVKTEIARGCYDLARRGLRDSVVQRCVERVTSPGSHPGDPAAVARLVGTHRFFHGKRAKALGPLTTAANAYDEQHDPELHLRLVEASIAAGRGADLCDAAKRLYRDQPLLPGAKEALRACGAGATRVDELARTIHEAQKAALLASRRTGREPAPSLPLESDDLRAVDIDPAAPGMVTVLVFFSTWCPHCATELPRVNAFVDAAREHSAMRGRVRVVGVRTAVERERVDYDSFIAAMKPQFPIYTDATLSLVFAQFARTQGLPAELPTVAILDEKGIVRFVLAPGDYRDTSQELTWAVEALLP